MKKYKDLINHRNISKLPDGFYRTISHNIVNFKGLTAFYLRKHRVDSDTNQTMWFYKDFDNETYSKTSREEFKTLVKLRNSSVWQAVNLEEEID